MQAELAAVHQAVLDYAEGWYLGDADRMDRALHPSFIKRRAVADGFETFGKRDLLEFIERGIGVEPDCEITIVVDDVSDSIATARCLSCRYVDLIHVGRFGDGWKLIHAYYRHLNDDERASRAAPT